MTKEVRDKLDLVAIEIYDKNGNDLQELREITLALYDAYNSGYSDGMNCDVN